jgi:hypothetical protein
MKLIYLTIALSLVGFTGLAAADLDLRTGCAAHFTSSAAAAEILGQKDEFIQRLSPFDRAARMKTDKAVSEEEFLKFVKANAAGWNEVEEKRICAAINALRPALERLPIAFPRRIAFVKTTGAEEGRAFYTRDTAIMMPEKETAAADEELLRKTIAHELFHILSRNNPELREKLYRLIGFTSCDEIDFPAELKSRKITNPDAPRNDHAIRVLVDGKEVSVVPILFSSAPNYDPALGGEFFNYLQLAFLPKGSKSQELLALQQISGFFEQIGRNTNYIIHPEEILAENFALLVIDKRDIPSPEILDKMRRVLEQK